MLVSIVMPTYNCEKFILKALDSVIAQTWTDWELFIVDDCSTDNTQQILEPYLTKYNNIHYIYLNMKSGVAIARTTAIQQAKGKYIAFLDSDDFWLPNKLEKQISYMENNKINFCATAYDLIDENDEDLCTTIIPPFKTDYKRMLRLSNPIGNLTVVYNQKALGKFSVPNISKRNDFALWLQILKKTDYCYGMDESLAVYRKGRKGSISNNKVKQMKYHWILYRDIEKHSTLRCVYEILCWVSVKTLGIGVTKVKHIK